MDKRQLTTIIQTVFKTLTPEKVSIFKAEEDLLGVRVISKAFQGMTFSDRFKQLGDLIEAQNPEELAPFIFIFEAFTPEELSRLPSENEDAQKSSDKGMKQSAQPLEP